MPSATSNEVAKRLVELREAYGAVAVGRVLTLLLVTDENHCEPAVAAANEASHENPCRILAVVRGSSEGAGRLDAQIRVGGDAGASEVIVLRTHGPLTAHSQSVVMPLLLPDAPLVTWWPGESPEVPADDPVGRLGRRRITDAAACKDAGAALADRAESYRPGDTDLAWTRLTLWRAVLAAALDQPPHETVTSARVVGAADSPSADLLAGWLSRSLDCPVTRARATDVEGLVRVELNRESGPVVLDRPGDEEATLTAPGRVDRHVALPRRTEAECIAEELRRLDPDEVYGEVVTTGLRRLRETGQIIATSAAEATS